MQGMIKMYNVEVLSKFPVVQHFPLGSLFSWDRDAAATELPTSVHSSSQPARESAPSISIGSASMRYPAQEGAQAPWASSRMNHPEIIDGNQAPWAGGRPSSIAANYPRPIKAGLESVRGVGPTPYRRTETPVNHRDTIPMRSARNATSHTDSDIASIPEPTKAPWAK